ncbi:hypothetical protein GOBAR_AA23382 [Gossypium barbadense]|uniref:Uncharacterized protein n=1 Tax=Gossypium barbadense TaxID=3634 RepID=A0A2P5X1S0_GOSBA|nr:hypothetical protein GOBAR_AA23382 [Gossypium barbadense]
MSQNPPGFQQPPYQQKKKLNLEEMLTNLPSNTKPNPRKQLNAINVQDEEGFIEPEPEPRQKTVVSRDQGEEMGLKEVQEPFSSSSRRPIHVDQRLQIEELDEWRTHAPRTHDKSKLRQDELNTFPNQLKVGDKVLLDAADPHIVTTKLNEEIPLKVLSIFPFGTVEVSHPKFGTFKVYNVIFTRKENRCPYFKEKEGNVIFLESYRGNSPPFPTIPHWAQEELFQILQARPLIAGRCIYWDAVEQCTIHCLLHLKTLTLAAASPYALPTTPEYERALALSTLTTPTFYGVCRTVSIGPYVTRLARHFGLLNTAAQESSLTLIGQMSSQGISSTLSMRMIEKCRGTYPPQYRLANLLRRRPMRTLLMMSPHSTRTHRLSHHHPLVQFMRRLHMLTSLSTSLDSSSSVFNDLITLMLPYSRFLYRAPKLIIA